MEPHREGLRRRRLDGILAADVLAAFGHVQPAAMHRAERLAPAVMARLQPVRAVRLLPLRLHRLRPAAKPVRLQLRLNRRRRSPAWNAPRWRARRRAIRPGRRETRRN